MYAFVVFIYVAVASLIATLCGLSWQSVGLYILIGGPAAWLLTSLIYDGRTFSLDEYCQRYLLVYALWPLVLLWVAARFLLHVGCLLLRRCI